jgi:hypothetical protein
VSTNRIEGGTALQAILAKFREDMELRGFAETSRRHYEGVYGFYTTWLEGRGRDLEETDESDVRGYALHMIREKRKRQKVGILAGSPPTPTIMADRQPIEGRKPWRSR